MSKANKATLSTEDKVSEATPSEATSNEVEQSNVGQSQLPTNANDLVKQVMATCKDHNIDPQEIVNLINVYIQYETPKVVPVGTLKMSQPTLKRFRVATGNA